MNTQIVPIERADDGALIVPSLTIAEGAGVEHRAVLQLVDNNTEDLEEFGTLAFEMRKSGGMPTRIALLNEQQSTLIMTYQRNTAQVRMFKMALVKTFFQMARQLQRPSAPAELSRMQILQMALEAEQKNEALEAQVAADAPKVAYVDAFVADNDALLFRSVASNLMVTEKGLREALWYGGWIYREQERRRNSKGELVNEYQWSEHADKKPYFLRVHNHRPGVPAFKGNVPYTLKVTTPGAAAIARFVERQIREHGSLGLALPVLRERWMERRTNAAGIPA